MEAKKRNKENIQKIKDKMKTIVKMNKKRELCWTINNINC